jgi:TetR/AcrR family transcriptional regulator, regulator of mycofactocin system
MSKEALEKILGRRERKKQQTRNALEATAWRLFQRKGFDQTTIEDITDAVDVSPRTFFRYFDSKEAVLFGDWRENLDRVSEAILARPTDEPPLVALFNAAQELNDVNAANQSQILLRRDLARKSKKVGEYERNVMMPELERSIANALAQRLGTNIESDLRPNLYAAVAVGALTAARRIWLASDCKTSMSELLQQAFDFVTYPADKVANKES